ncbi:MAG: helix-turn-helix domain-containing protein [Sporichthyaceae bacterium]
MVDGRELGLFWADLAEDRRRPDFERDYLLASLRVATVDDVVRTLDEARIARGMTKAALARAAGVPPESVRRLLTAPSTNPQLSLVAQLAAVLGLRVQLQPMTAAERSATGVLRGPTR